MEYFTNYSTNMCAHPGVCETHPHATPLPRAKAGKCIFTRTPYGKEKTRKDGRKTKIEVAHRTPWLAMPGCANFPLIHLRDRTTCKCRCFAKSHTHGVCCTLQTPEDNTYVTHPGLRGKEDTGCATHTMSLICVT